MESSPGANAIVQKLRAREKARGLITSAIVDSTVTAAKQVPKTKTRSDIINSTVAGAQQLHGPVKPSSPERKNTNKKTRKQTRWRRGGDGYQDPVR